MKPLNRGDIIDLEDIPNVGPSIAHKLRRVGIHSPKNLAGKDPCTMYDDLCDATGVRQDPWPPESDKTPASSTCSSLPSASWPARHPSRGGSTRRNGNGRWRHERHSLSSNVCRHRLRRHHLRFCHLCRHHLRHSHLCRHRHRLRLRHSHLDHRLRHGLPVAWLR